MFIILHDNNFFLSTFVSSKRGQRCKFCIMIMAAFKVGQVVKYLKPFPDEDPEQQYVIREIKEGLGTTRIDISPLNLKLAFPPVYTVGSNELIKDEHIQTKSIDNI